LYKAVERRRFGSSDLEITPVGIGTAPIGSLPGSWWANWGPQDEGDSIRAVHAPDDFRRTHRFAELDLGVLHERLRRDGGTVTRGALRFMLAHPAVTGAIVGVRNEREARELADIGSAV
jgi:aryl-alcohol dehydrogenase-like predicted oxidoreductase